MNEVLEVCDMAWRGIRSRRAVCVFGENTRRLMQEKFP
jgi:hypothetical protein